MSPVKSTTLYDRLGVAPAASAAEITAAYRRLAKETHPDLHPGDKDAEDRFKAIAAAYAVLKDPDQRRRYDAGEIDDTGAEQDTGRRFYRDHASSRQGEKYGEGLNADNFAADLGSLFGDLFRQWAERRTGPARGMDVRYSIKVPFLMAALGGQKTLTLPNGRPLEITIPAGIADGQMVRLKGQGEPGDRGSRPGDAVLRVMIEPHTLFTRDGKDIIIDLPLTMAEALLGAQVRVPTIHGTVAARVPEGTNTGTILRLKGKGIAPGGTQEPGDQLVRARIVLPRDADAELAEALARWQARSDDNPREDWEADLA